MATSRTTSRRPARSGTSRSRSTTRRPPAPRPEKRPRLIFGALLFTFALLGVLHIFSGLPENNAHRMYAGGAFGFVSGGLLAKGVTSWVALPVLALGIGFSVLVFTGTR